MSPLFLPFIPLAMRRLYHSSSPVAIEKVECPLYSSFAFGYTGTYTDTVTGDQLHGVRWYDPSSQRWLTQDWLGLGPDSNPYRYCGNAPTDGTDPSGMATMAPPKPPGTGPTNPTAPPQTRAGEVLYPAETISVADLEDIVKHKGPVQLVVGAATWTKEIPIVTTVATFGDVQKEMKAKACGKKIEVLEFKGHSLFVGKVYGQAIDIHGGDGSRSPTAAEIDDGNVKWIAAQLVGGLLAKDAIIVLDGCSIGNFAKFNTNPRRIWPQILADMTQRTVYADGGAGQGTIVGQDASVDSVSNNQRETPWHFADKDNTYYIFRPH